MRWKFKNTLIAPYFSNTSFLYYTLAEHTSHQYSILQDILSLNAHTTYGEKHNFHQISSYTDFVEHAPICVYEEYYEPILAAMKGWKNILTKEPILYFAKTAGTTSWNSKYVPITMDCLKKNNFLGMKQMIANYLHHNPDSTLLGWKSLVLGGGFFKNQYTQEENIWYISAILQKESWMLWDFFREPSQDISFMHDRDAKLDQIIASTWDENITSMWWVTSRAVVLLERFLQRTWKDTMLDIRPGFELYMSGWLNFEPYRKQFELFFPSPRVRFYQVYNASEWFFWIQYSNETTDMLLLTHHGVFYEFIDMDTYFEGEKSVSTIEHVKPGKNYAVVITTYAGLYRYEIWDVIQFTDCSKLLFKITWRTKVSIDVFSEHVIVDNTDQAIVSACEQTWAIAMDYHVWPVFLDGNAQWRHERVVEFKKLPYDMEQFTAILDQELQNANSYYAWKRAWNLMIREPIVHSAPWGTFVRWFASKWKLGGQFKIPKLSNTRTILDELLDIL